MVFSSTIFLFIFLPIILGGYYLIRNELRNFFLVIMSLLFYAWGEPRFVLVMIGSIIMNYIFGILINLLKRQPLTLRRITLVIATCANLSLLFYYKYLDFFIININKLFGNRFALRGIALPIGISFFTFQGLSYIFDLYMGKVQVQRNIIHIALYIALFPQLIAGPIVRYIDINEQIRNRKHSLYKFSYGVQRFIIGLSKKVILSNTFALAADMAFNTPSTERSIALAWIGAIGYSIQIYFDFSGYSDMAIGLGKMFGFDFLENFNYPYISTSVTEFWRRWHISLSSWFRDYVYIPLGGNRQGNVYFNLAVVFFVTGMWHGAQWSFIVWGLWHGLFLILERIQKNTHYQLPIHLPNIIKRIYVMSVVLVGWVIFRASNLSTGFVFLQDLLGMNGNLLYDSMSLLLCRDNIVLFLIALVCSMPITSIVNNFCDKYIIPNRVRAIILPLGYGLLFIISISFTVISTYNPFIYFNF